MRSSTRELLEIVNERGPEPATETHRVDGKIVLRFHVDDHDDRYVAVEDSAESDDFLVTCRDSRDVRSVVVVGARDVLALVRTEISRLGEVSRGRLETQGVSSVSLESFAHTAGVFLEDWHASRLTAQEVCETLWTAAKIRKIVRVVRESRLSEASKTG